MLPPAARDNTAKREAELARLKARRARLLDAMEDGLIDKTEFRIRAEKIQAAIREVRGADVHRSSSRFSGLDGWCSSFSRPLRDVAVHGAAGHAQARGEVISGPGRCHS